MAKSSKKIPKIFSGNQSHATVINPLTENGNPVLKIMGAGPRDLSNSADAENIYKVLEKRILETRAKHMAKTGGDIHIITGMQLGFDEFMARVAFENNIPYTAVVPNKTFGQYYWGKKANRMSEFQKYIKNAQNVVYGEDVFGPFRWVKGPKGGPYFGNMHANMARNQLMTEMADRAMVFDIGTPGTKDAIERLEAAKIPFERIERPGFSIQNAQILASTNTDTQDLINHLKTTRTNPAPEVIKPIEEIVEKVSDEISESVVESVSPIESIVESTVKNVTEEATKISEAVTEAALAEEAERLKVLQTLAPELQMSTEELQAAGLTRLDNGMIDFTEGVTESVAPIEAVTEGMPTGIVDEATEAIEDLARPIVSTIDEGIGDIGSAIIHSNKLKFGALGAAVIGGLGVVNKMKAKRDLSTAEKRSKSNSVFMSNRNSMKTFSGTLDSGYESLNVLRNRKRS